MSGYLENLKRVVAERHAAAAAARAHKARPLHEKIRDWFAGLPAQERRTHYTMAELALIFNTAPGRIGTALHLLGWERRRRFSGSDSYCRYWVPAHVELH